MRTLTLLLALFPALILTDPAAAFESEVFVVTAVVDGDTLTVDRPVDGAREVRLVGIEAPHLPLGRLGFPTWPLAHAAQEVLQTLALGQRVRLIRSEHSQDRHGRLLAQAFREDGAWLQAEMLRRGFARVHSFADNRARIDELLTVETAARAANLGIWSHPFYAVRTPDTVRRDIDSFQIVEGRVVEAKRVNRNLYLNFGTDWRTDFTVTIPVSRLKSFEAAGLAPLALAGRVVRVRGWITSYNGPMIEASHPEQIDIVDEPSVDPEHRGRHSPCCSSRPRTRAAWNMAR